MKRFYITVFVGVAALFGLAWWKNSLSYGSYSKRWRFGKSVIDCSFVILAALYLPGLLVAWIVTHLTRGIKRRSVQITLAVLCGVIFSAVGGVALEVLCVLGIVSVDLLTGANGILGMWTQKIPDSFLSSLGDKNHTA